MTHASSAAASAHRRRIQLRSGSTAELDASAGRSV